MFSFLSFIRAHFRPLFLGLLVLLLVLLGSLSYRQHLDPKPAEVPTQVEVGENIYALEIARTAPELQTGLGGRESLCPSCAMLFLFQKPSQSGFWMKDMRFPLDIVWLMDDTVVHIERNIPFDSRETFYPKNEADRVLEFNAGEVKNLDVGDQVRFSYE